MRLISKDYLFSTILLGSVLLGGVLGAFLGPKASILKPFGDLFINLLFMIIVPMVFFSIASAIASMGEMKGNMVCSMLIARLVEGKDWLARA